MKTNSPPPRIGLRDPRRLLRKYLKRALWPLAAVMTPAALLCFRCVSRETLHRFAELIARFWCRLSPASRALGMGNLDLIYGSSIPPSEKMAILEGSIACIIKSMLDYFHYSYHADQLADLVIIDRAVEARLRQLDGRGAVVLTAHLGNWELLLAVLRKYGMISEIAREQKQFDSFVVACRERYRVGTLHDNSAEGRLIAERLAAGQKVSAVLDRNVSHAKGVISLFMGKPAFTPYFPVNLACYGGVPVMPAFLIPEGRRYRLFVEEPFMLTEKNDRIGTYLHYSQVFMDIIGDYVRRYPQCWFWAHKRWHRPKGEVRGGLELLQRQGH